MLAADQHSLDGWFSCHSCHTNGHTNGLRADTFGVEDRGAPKKIVSLEEVERLLILLETL